MNVCVYMYVCVCVCMCVCVCVCVCMYVYVCGGGRLRGLKSPLRSRVVLVKCPNSVFVLTAPLTWLANRSSGELIRSKRRVKVVC